MKADSLLTQHALQHEVEDTKAGKYERGRLLLTTLRVIWFSSHASSINLCLGLATVARLDMSTKARSGALRPPSLHPRVPERHATILPPVRACVPGVALQALRRQCLPLAERAYGASAVHACQEFAAC